MALKILFLSHAFAPAIGGIETSSEFLANAFVAAGHEVRLMTTTAAAGEDFPYPVIRTTSPLEMLQHHAWADVVFENNPCLRLSWPKALFGTPSLVVLHTWINRLDGTIGFVDRVKFRWLARANKVVAISEAVRRRCWPQATIIHNSYNEDLFRIRTKERPQDFVFLGRLVSDKGAQLAVAAFIDLVFTHPVPELKNARLTIIGEGPDRAELEAMAAALPDPSRVRFAGSLQGDALVEELNQHRFQFIPSTWEEPFGIVALEGIACGLIPIASDGGGLPDAIGEAGVTFERGQLSALIAATTALVQSPEKQARCRQAAPRHLAGFSSETIKQEFLTALESVANGRAKQVAK
ncbi:MAG TPA: glycosyltransferase family 4 protein [Hymenobacter sp.]|jgi:glycosyltransferase involved in cell wall biosynthesis